MPAAEIPLLLTLPLLLVASAFFSGSETALFGLTSHERQALRQSGGLGAKAALTLLTNPRMLLITLLLGNMIANVTYFVIASVLALRAPSPALAVVFSVAPVVVIILLGEVTPKLVANSRRTRWAQLLAPPLLALHRLVGPARTILNSFVIEPLSRLVRPAKPPGVLSAAELSALLELSERQGTIDTAEARLLDAVTELGALRVREVMTPRVSLEWLPLSAERDDVATFVRRTGLTHVPLCATSPDGGVDALLDARRYLALADPGPARNHADPPLFVPEQARLDKLLEVLRARSKRYAIVVDEYGGVAGVVALADVVKRMMAGVVGHAADAEPADAGAGRPGARPLVERVGPGTYRVAGRLSAREWAEAFGHHAELGATTVAGLIHLTLGRIPAEGESAVLGNVRLEVESLRGGAIESILVSIDPGAPAPPPTAGAAPQRPAP